MLVEQLIDHFKVFEHILAIILGTPRIFIIMQIVPFMGSSVVTGQLRTTLAFACYMIIHPTLMPLLPDADFSGKNIDFLFYGAILAKEVLIGLFIGFLSGILFWAVQATGFFIDNQRGLSQAAGAEILSGEETSPLGGFLFQCVTYIFFYSGAFLVFLQFIYQSYAMWPVLELSPLTMIFNNQFPLLFAEQVNYLMLLMLLLSGPIVMACLLTDLSLGLMNRFASQLNVYVLAMPIKSALASFLIIFYLYVFLKQVVPLFDDIMELLEKMRHFA